MMPWILYAKNCIKVKETEISAPLDQPLVKTLSSDKPQQIHTVDTLRLPSHGP